MGFELVVAIIALVVTAATTAFQIIQAKKMKRAAEAAADARKGFEIVSEGQPSYLPILYGRALVGGIRSWSATSGNFKYVAPNSDKSYLTGDAGVAGYTYNYKQWGDDTATFLDKSATVNAQGAGYLNQSLDGGRNDFLFYQQALCVGPIAGVRDIVVDGSRYIDDPTLGSYGKIEKTVTTKEHTGVKAALRVDIHNNGGTADSIIAANFSERSNALFTGMAHLSAVIRIDRDNPQFNNIPPIQVYAEGRLVRWVTNGVISTTQTYEQDPTNYRYNNGGPYCLLDYMLDPLDGGGYDLSEIDLASFEHAEAIRTFIVQTNMNVGGKIWQPTDGTNTISKRDIPLYECNMLVDTSKPIRDNIESILATMGDTRLVWSNGKYKLSIQYPLTNADIKIDMLVNDDNFAFGEEFSVQWPSASDRFNFGTVRFHNEHENFTEDSVSWPPKFNNSYKRGIGAQTYPSGVGSWDDTTASGRLLNQYNVWKGTGNSTSLQYMLYVDNNSSGNYTLTYAGDDSCAIAITNNATGASVYNGSVSDVKNLKTASISLNPGVYKIVITGTNTGGGSNDYKGVAAKIDSASTILWNTRLTAYSAYIDVNETNGVYYQMLAEDNGLKLETDVFADGITDPFHALAKCEELVRTSRSAAQYEFTILVQDKLPEPGDFIQFAVADVFLGIDVALYMRVDETKVSSDGTKVTLNTTRFDVSQLAWANKDDVYSSAPNLYSSFIPQPYALNYLPPVGDRTNSSGQLVTTPVYLAELAGYVYYVYRPGVDATDSNGNPVYSEIGRSPLPFYDLPAINAASAFFGVRAVSSGGKLSQMTLTDPYNAVFLNHNWTRHVTIVSNALTFIHRPGDAVYTPTEIDLQALAYAYVNPVYHWHMVSGANTFDSNQQSIVVTPFDEETRVYQLSVSEANDPTISDLVSITLFSKVQAEPGATRGAPAGTMVGDLEAQAAMTQMTQNGFNLALSIIKNADNEKIINDIKYINGTPIATVIDHLQTQFSDGNVSYAQDLALLGASGVGPGGTGKAFYLSADTAYVENGVPLVSSIKTLRSDTDKATYQIDQINDIVYAPDGSATLRSLNTLNDQGHITGTFNTSTGGYSEYIIAANTFRVIDPNGGSPITPFQISQGVVYMNEVVVGKIKVGTGGTVSIPSIQSATNTMQFSSTWTTQMTVIVVLDGPGTIFAQASAKLAFPSGDMSWNARLTINGVAVFATGGQKTSDSIALSAPLYMNAAGTYTVTLDVMGNSGVGIASRTLFGVAYYG
jgi:hypothetical protein